MNHQTPDEFTLRDLLRIFNNRRAIVIYCATAVFGLAVLACVFMTRRYESTGVFELQKSSSDTLDLQDAMGAAAGGASDSLSLNTDLQTQVGVLESDALSLRIIKELDLEHNRDFRPRFTPLAWIVSRITPKGAPDPAGATLEESPNRRENLLRAYQDHLKVKVDSGTRLIEVSFTNSNPKTAASVVNHLIQALVDYNFQTKYTATNDVSGWLEGQLGDLRKQSEQLQAKVVSLQEDSGIFGVSGTDLAGKPVVYSPSLDRLQQSSTLLSQAEINRVLKESIYKATLSRDPDTISQLAGTTIISQSGTGVSDSLTLVASLRQQEAALKAQIGQDAAQFGPAYPKLIQERASLKSVEASLKQEIDRIAQRAKTDYDIALATENGARATYESDRKAAKELNSKTIEYTILARESQESQDLYQDLLKRLKEAGILEGLQSSNITVVDPALPPAKPSSPKVLILLLGGLFGGLLLGGGAALLAEAVDNKIRGTEEIDNLQIPLLGILPIIDVTANRQRSVPSDSAILFDAKHNEFSESIRRLRSNLLIARGGTPPQVILITSSNPGEGKSTISLNLAAALAQYGKSVLLVEADLRRPVFASRLQLPTSNGLSTLLSNVESSVPAMYPSRENLVIIPAGPIPPYPSELLGSASLLSLLDEWRRDFDFVVLDSPPILPVADTQTLVAKADATVLIARSGVTTRVALRRSFNLLVQHAKVPAHPAVGVVLNAVPVRSAAYYGYYGSYSYKGYYSSEEEKNRDE